MLQSVTDCKMSHILRQPLCKDAVWIENVRMLQLIPVSISVSVTERAQATHTSKRNEEKVKRL